MEIFGIIFIVALGSSIPLCLIWTHHLRKMAEIVYARRADGTPTEIETHLIREVTQLKQIVAEQAIVVDDISTMHRRLLEKSDAEQAVRNRIGTN
jgi:hypothetical protein